MQPRLMSAGRTDRIRLGTILTPVPRRRWWKFPIWVVGTGADAGATWWLESNWQVPGDKVEQYARRRVSAGPPIR